MIIVRALLGALLAGAAAVSLAQEPYPSHPITMVVAFPPGGVADRTENVASPDGGARLLLFRQTKGCVIVQRYA